MVPLSDLMPLARVAKDLHVHPATVHRWMIRGVGGVRLQALRVGGRWSTTREWVQDFLAKLNRENVVLIPKLTSPAADADFQRRAASAGAQLDALLPKKGQPKSN